MTDHHDEYGDILRRALHAEADTVVPAADGLERIRSRIAEQKPRFGSGRLGSGRLGWPWSGSSWSVSSWLGSSWPAGGWVRPAMAGAAALAIAGVVVSAPSTVNSFMSAGRNPAEQTSHGQSGTSGAVQPGESAEPSAESPPPRRTSAIQATAPHPVTTSPEGRGCSDGTGEAASPNPSASAPARDTPTCPSPVTAAPTIPVVTTPPPPPAEPPPPSPGPEDTQTPPTTDREPDPQPAPSP
ncbi:MAG TPA: hypothetical protein VGP70_01250 [Actinomadura sp.]|jgi:hypothetical protein|nr:hypothetical protein [Actinomadura sp.]